jgi:hypothetical protein
MRLSVLWPWNGQRGAVAKWFLKKGKNDGKSFGILWELEPWQQQLLLLLEMFP